MGDSILRITSDETGHHCQVFPPTRRHALFGGDSAHKGCFSKYGKAGFGCIISKAIV